MSLRLFFCVSLTSQGIHFGEWFVEQDEDENQESLSEQEQEQVPVPVFHIKFNQAPESESSAAKININVTESQPGGKEEEEKNEPPEPVGGVGHRREEEEQEEEEGSSSGQFSVPAVKDRTREDGETHNYSFSESEHSRHNPVQPPAGTEFATGGSQPEFPESASTTTHRPGGGDQQVRESFYSALPFFTTWIIV